MMVLLTDKHIMMVDRSVKKIFAFYILILFFDGRTSQMEEIGITGTKLF
jgi:sorbitol-specific phosphotransferase system component IIA